MLTYIHQSKPYHKGSLGLQANHNHSDVDYLIPVSRISGTGSTSSLAGKMERSGGVVVHEDQDILVIGDQVLPCRRPFF